MTEQVTCRNCGGELVGDDVGGWLHTQTMSGMVPEAPSRADAGARAVTPSPAPVPPEARALASLAGDIERDVSLSLGEIGGFLRCETCRRKAPLGDAGKRAMRTGWPKCCGYTMRWWTQRQIDAGEVPT